MRSEDSRMNLGLVITDDKTNSGPMITNSMTFEKMSLGRRETLVLIHETVTARIDEINKLGHEKTRL